MSGGTRGVKQTVASLGFESQILGQLATITLTGTTDARAHATLGTLLEQVATTVEGEGITAVRVDIRELEFMNSSSFKQFVTWIVRIRDLPENQRYTLEFVCEPRYHWQARSLGSLQMLGRGIVKVAR